MNTKDIKLKRRTRRKLHIRKLIKGNNEMPRLTVYRSLNEIYAQIINDVDGKTIISASSIDIDLKEKVKAGIKKIDKSKLVGQLIAKRAQDSNIKKVAFDRNGYLYHGRIKALAEAAREGGLIF
jgi:large subunit ribosomal protein L18